ncbi:MAG: AAA family ATPase [Schleiferiaceae bacterium]|nr:AAA family ATPase [Schleiferiaceae bacterium]
MHGLFPFELTENQNNAITNIAQFLSEEKFAFVLKGYAGTGKTTLIATLVKQRNLSNFRTILLAPTGRAAKVMGNYAGKQAFTIHRFIYMPKQSGGKLSYRLRQNKSTRTLFVVDESSMIGDQRDGQKNSLLEDLLLFVSEGAYCSILFVGDNAQLPPVGQQLSPALDIVNLQYLIDDKPKSIELTEVVRQAQKSYIVQNATIIRSGLEQQSFDHLQFNVGPDFIRLTDGYEIQDRLTECYQQEQEETRLIVRSNKRANLYNQQIRSRILWLENELASGDELMVVKNNYFWVDPKSEMSFIANGETIEILSFKNRVELYGYHFVDAEVRFPDFPNEKPIDVKLMLDVLSLDGPNLDYTKQTEFFNEVMLDYQHLPKTQAIKATLNNEYYNALQVKFAYAITCHKAQGGQWKNIFVEQSWIPDGKMDADYFRWLYTAITRATGSVYLLGFKNEYFNDLD